MDTCIEALLGRGVQFLLEPGGVQPMTPLPHFAHGTQQARLMTVYSSL
jgi:hypothetical protein